VLFRYPLISQKALADNLKRVLHNILKISRGSLFELETQLLLVKEIKLIKINEEVFIEINEIAKMINALIKRVEQNIKS